MINSNSYKLAVIQNALLEALALTHSLTQNHH